MTDEELWGRTNCNWWANLPWMDDGSSSWPFARTPWAENVVICSTPAAWPGSAEGKLRWIEQQMPNYARRFVLTPDKSWCADGRHVAHRRHREERHSISSSWRCVSALPTTVELLSLPQHRELPAMRNRGDARMNQYVIATPILNRTSSGRRCY